MVFTRELVYFTDNDSGSDKIPVIRQEIKDLEEILSKKVEEAIELDNNNALLIETTKQIDKGVRVKILKDYIVVSDDSFKNKKLINLK